MEFQYVHRILDEWLRSNFQTDVIDVRLTEDEMGLLFKKRRD